VFTTGLGQPVYPDTVSQLMAKVIKAYNQPEGDKAKPARLLPHARLRDLRHVHATMLLLAGVPVHVVADRLGHADSSITLRVYAHVIRQHAAGSLMCSLLPSTWSTRTRTTTATGPR
jgi:integrase